MPLTLKHEDVTPQLAHQYLGLSDGNRSINSDYVLSLAVSMETGRWDPDASELVFDESGALIDGHHRLHAIATYDKPVRILVKRGVAKSARGIIDTGRSRNIGDLHRMFRPGAGFTNGRRAALSSCIVALLKGRMPPIRTLDVYDSWERLFADGLDAAAGMSDSGVVKQFRVASFSGAFAFAHKTDPKRVEAFMRRTIDGVGLEKGEPAYTLRELMLSRTSSGMTSGVGRYVLLKKISQAIHADIRGESYGKAMRGGAGLEYFRKAYDTKAAERLVGLWSLPVKEIDEV